MKGKKKPGLTARQQRFVQEYLADPSMNATAAAKRSGYRGSHARKYGSLLLSNSNVAAAIAAAQAARSERTGITQDRVLNEIARVAFADTRRVMSWGPGGVKLISSASLSDDDAAAVGEVSETTNLHGGSLRLKTHDKIKALELLGRHLGMWKDKVEHSGPGGGPVPVSHTAVTAEQLAEAVRSVRDSY